ncbi:MAG TPA: ATP phosphoribosyltransferase regulatory subunit [Burkholderiales bacterium]|jgi:ATP phosphoribosyltransferase regulatory subunit|nr:ATP phosphoribosyltransferase regulatory subunit [Burkholderiales bacterium]
MPNWLLPEYVEDILPLEAQTIERLRARMLEVFRVHGYELVLPPMLEYVDSLLTGTGHDLDLRTFKLVDQLSGRMMGLRADMTPQAARIDAHLLNRQGVTRLCYCGTVVHTRPRGLTATREPLQIGAEIYGHAGIESDIEIQRLLRTALSVCGLNDICLDLSHVGVFQALAEHAGLGDAAESELLDVLVAKDRPRLVGLTANFEAQTRAAFLALAELYGGPEVIERARKTLPQFPAIGKALDDLTTLAQDNGAELSIDLADLRGYHYHSGVVFAAYQRGLPNAIALGGRYDEVGRAFGRARPATGFSLDLRDLARVAPEAQRAGAILAPHSNDAKLRERISELRREGEAVIVDLPGHEASREELGCDRQLVLKNGIWEVVSR